MLDLTAVPRRARMGFVCQCELARGQKLVKVLPKATAEGQHRDCLQVAAPEAGWLLVTMITGRIFSMAQIES